MKTLTTFLLTIISFPVLMSVAQTTGDFRTKQTGDWNNINTWQRFNGSSWVNATYFPTYSDNVITVLAGHTVTVTATVKVDQTVVYGVVVVNADPVDLDINDGAGTDLQVFGTITNYGDVDKESAALIVYESGSKYFHARNGGTIETASWNSNAECQVTGITTTDPLTSSYNQAFGCFTWNCPSQTVVATTVGNLTTINGTFRMKSTGTGSLKISTSASTTLTIGGSFIMSGGYFNITDGSADNMVIIHGDSLKITGGTLTEYGSQPDDAIIRLNKSGTLYYEKTGGIISGSVSFEVLSGCTLDLGTSVLGDPLYSSGYFTLNSGAGLKTQHAQGISTSSSTGCVQMISTKTYSNSANYSFYRNGSQVSGNGFQTIQNALITIGSSANATALTLTNGSLTVNNKLMLISSSSANSSISGTVSYGSSAALEYQGASPQTTASGEFPASNGPFNLIINNTNGVLLHTSRTINGTLYLTAGAFSIGANTLTLNGALTITSGTLTGGSSSNISFGGSGASANLPAIVLHNLTINRANGIVLGGDVTTHGTLSLTNGILTIGSNTLTMNGLLTKTSGTLTGGNSSVIIFGGTGTSTDLPSITLHSLTINRPNGISLLGNLTIKNQLNLTSGDLNIGNNTIFMDGIISQISGNLGGGTGSNIQIAENAALLSLPPVVLNNLTLNRAAGLLMVSDVTIHGNLTLTNGNFAIGSNTLILYGHISQSGGTISGGVSSNLVFEENASSVNLPSITLNELTVKRSGGVNTAGNINLNGDLTIQNGLLKATGKILATGGNININNAGTLWLDANTQLKITAGKTLNVNSGGLLKITGNGSNQTLITQNGTSRGYYGFSVKENGTIAPQYCIFEYMDSQGVKINQGALVDGGSSFYGCSFREGQSGGQLLTINNGQDLTIENAVFPENTWGSQYNVSKTADLGTVYFIEATGLFAGAAYENDPYNRISWSGAGVTQDLDISGGWSGISTRISPNNPVITSMFQPIVNQLVVLYNLSGMYWPGQNINTLGNWDAYSGYAIKVTADVTLSVTGQELLSKTVWIKAGWNLIPVFSQVETSVFLGNLPGFVLAKGVANGEILWPAYNINTMGDLMVGKSYFVYSTQAGSITYPGNKNQPIGKNVVKPKVTTPWNEVVPTPVSHLVAFNCPLQLFEPGDIVGGFTSEGICAGMVQIEDLSAPFGLTLFGNDPTSDEKDGFDVGETIEYKLFRPTTGEVFDLEVNYNLLMNSGNFESNGLSEITQVKMTASAINKPSATALKIYPNPTCGNFIISGFINRANIEIMNAFGEKIYRNETYLPASPDLSGYPKGVYLIKVEVENKVFFEKLIIK